MIRRHTLVTKGIQGLRLGHPQKPPLPSTNRTMNRIIKPRSGAKQGAANRSLAEAGRRRVPARAGSSARLFQWKKILIPVDYRESAVTALQCAAELAVASGAKLVVLHIFNPGRASLYDREGRRISGGESRQHAHQHLIEWIASVSLPPGIMIQPLIHIGEPLDEVIIATASDCKADLIVMAGHARHFWQRILDVKTTSRVVRYSPCDVYYVCHNARLPRPTPAKRIAASTD